MIQMLNVSVSLAICYLHYRWAITVFNKKCHSKSLLGPLKPYHVCRSDMIQKNTGDISRRCLKTKPLESTNWPFDNLPGEEIKICFTSFIFYNTCCCCCVFISLNCACDKPDLEEIKILNPTLKAAFEAFSPLDRCVVVSQESSVVLGDFLSAQHKHMKTYSADFC